MTDIQREGTFAQKRGVCVGAFHIDEELLLGGDPTSVVATLPARSIVSSVRVNVSSPSTTVGAAIAVTINGVAMGTALVDAEGVIDLSVAPEYFETGGAIEIEATAPPGAGDMVIDLVIQYIELDLTTGCYTEIADWVAP